VTTKRIRTTTRTAAPAITARRPFTTSGALFGEFLTAGSASRLGRLPDEHRPAWREAVKKHGRTLYVVWSYGTPIGWAGPGEPLHIPDVKYSPTTTKHQGNLRRAAR
jgi:hypothetical protein